MHEIAESTTRAFTEIQEIIYFYFYFNQSNRALLKIDTKFTGFWGIFPPAAKIKLLGKFSVAMTVMLDDFTPMAKILSKDEIRKIKYHSFWNYLGVIE